jgi:hypothetical protein
MPFNLSLSRKSDAQPALAPVWHPNFRNFERLPDTKVVRTTFFVNTAAIATTVCLALWLGYREYHIHSLGEQIADAQKEIDSNSRQNAEALRLTKAFAADEKKLAEAEAFVAAPITPSEFIMLIGQTLPKEISIEFVDLKINAGMELAAFRIKGLVAGTPDTAAGIASSYVDALRANQRLGPIFGAITLESLNRDARSNFLTFDILLKVKPPAKAKN